MKKSYYLCTVSTKSHEYLAITEKTYKGYTIISCQNPQLIGNVYRYRHGLHSRHRLKVTEFENMRHESLAISACFKNIIDGLHIPDAILTETYQDGNIGAAWLKNGFVVTGLVDDNGDIDIYEDIYINNHLY